MIKFAMEKSKRKATVIEKRPAGPDHQVVSFLGDGAGHCKKPCSECPWLVKNAGSFPAEAFRLSARTAYDMSRNVFACHMAGIDHGKTCAGFLLRGADNNLAIRLKLMSGTYKSDVHENGQILFDSYREMAEANGVGADDPVLKPCR